MYYKYNINGTIHTVYRSPFNKNNVNVYKGTKEYTCNIIDNEYFVYNGTKVFLDDYIRLTLSDLLEKISNNDIITRDDICNVIMTEGIDNIYFTIPMNTVSVQVYGIGFANVHDTVDKRCVVDEREYAVKDGYKMGFRVCDEDYDGTTIQYRSFYADDLASLINNRQIKIGKF